jgi:hypothetical protein
MRPRNPNRMPPVGTSHVVTIHALARMLGWTTQRIRRLDDLLRPARAANGERVFDIDRALSFVRAVDMAPRGQVPIVINAAEYKALRAQWRAERSS